jgi:acetate kinase
MAASRRSLPEPHVRCRGSGASGGGVKLDAARNGAATADIELSASGAAVRTLVVQAREDLEIARQVRALGKMTVLHTRGHEAS